MKLSLVCLFILIVAFTPENAMAQTAQSNAARPTSEQSLEELVREVRQLRATLQRMNAATYKGHLMLERLKLQQDQVSQMSRELNNTRERLSDVRAQQIRLKEYLRHAETGVESGMKQTGELASLKTELENLSQQEQRTAARDTQLTNELELERAKLNDLNDRLNALELEMAPIKP